MKSEANLEIFKHNDNELILNRWKFNDIIKYFVNCGNCSKKNLGTWKLYWLKQLGTAVDRSLIVAEIICLLVGQSIKRIKKKHKSHIFDMIILNFLDALPMCFFSLFVIIVYVKSKTNLCQSNEMRNKNQHVKWKTEKCTPYNLPLELTSTHFVEFIYKKKTQESTNQKPYALNYVQNE